MPLVEVVPHPQTSPEVYSRAVEFYKFLGKKPILVAQESPGFVANRLQAAILSEACSLVVRGIVSAEDAGMSSYDLLHLSIERY
jgi:3-hydroxyacyl-CoA dehydrogenase